MTREEAIKVLSSYDVNGVWADVDGKPYNAEEQAEAFDMAIKALEELPKRRKEAKRWKRKALKAKTRYGEWMFRTNLYPGNEMTAGYVCSICGNDTRKPRNYCPICGARMTKE